MREDEIKLKRKIDSEKKTLEKNKQLVPSSSKCLCLLKSSFERGNYTSTEDFCFTSKKEFPN